MSSRLEGRSLEDVTPQILQFLGPWNEPVLKGGNGLVVLVDRLVQAFAQGRKNAR